jgi:hypothetical protein
VADLGVALWLAIASPRPRYWSPRSPFPLPFLAFPISRLRRRSGGSTATMIILANDRRPSTPLHAPPPAQFNNLLLLVMTSFLPRILPVSYSRFALACPCSPFRERWMAQSRPVDSHSHPSNAPPLPVSPPPHPTPLYSCLHYHPPRPGQWSSPAVSAPTSLSTVRERERQGKPTFQLLHNDHILFQLMLLPVG